MLLLQTGVQAQTYQQVWSDEFNGSIGPDWVFETGGGGWGNNEKQYYQASNASISNNELVITARKQSVGGLPYTSARLKTAGRKSWKYGKMEARARFPVGQGLWPAVWMLGDNIGSVGWPACGEIDILEHVNTDNLVYGTIHWESNGHASYGGNTTVTTNNYHVYAVEWTPSMIKWFVDGIQYHEANIANSVNSTEEFHRNFFYILNLAVAGNWPGQTVDESRLPATLNIDYVRTFQLGSTPTGVATMYKDCNYAGTAVGLPVGDYNLAALNSRGILNEDISSLRVTSGYEVQVYQNDNFTGSSLILSADDACLVDNGFNDNTTSLRVRVKSASFTRTVQAESYNAMLGVQLENTTDAGGGQNVGWIDNNDWMAYNSINVPSTGSYLIEYRVASPNATGRISLDLNAGAIQLGVVNVPNTGGWQNWTTVSHTVTINAGTYNFGIFASVGGWNCNWWRITRVGAGARSIQDVATQNSEEPVTVTSYPNPFMGSTKIKLNLAESGQTNLTVHSGIGNKLSELHDGYLDAGAHEFDFAAENLPAGVYLYSVIHKGKRMTGKIIKR